MLYLNPKIKTKKNYLKNINYIKIRIKYKNYDLYFLFDSKFIFSCIKLHGLLEFPDFTTEIINDAFNKCCGFSGNLTFVFELLINRNRLNYH